uniref:Uncharacterized protein n=1 Tax=Monodelphis domestica TaxID=13616 RepID=A0A5F8GHA7_MONDO
MPLRKEGKVMQCWYYKWYGHRTGNKPCPFSIRGNQKLEQFRAHEDHMYDIIREHKHHEKDVRIQQLGKLLEDSTLDEDGSSSKKHKKRKKEKKKKKHCRKHKIDQTKKGDLKPHRRKSFFKN